MIGNFQVKQIFVDYRVSVNIMFYDDFLKIVYTAHQLEYAKYGFNYGKIESIRNNSIMHDCCIRAYIGKRDIEFLNGQSKFYLQCNSSKNKLACL